MTEVTPSGITNSFCVSIISGQFHQTMIHFYVTTRSLFLFPLSSLLYVARSPFFPPFLGPRLHSWFCGHLFASSWGCIIFRNQQTSILGNQLTSGTYHVDEEPKVSKNIHTKQQEDHLLMELHFDCAWVELLADQTFTNMRVVSLLRQGWLVNIAHGLALKGQFNMPMKNVYKFGFKL